MTYVTVAQIAKRWQVSRMTVYRLVDAGTLKSVRIGRSVRIQHDDVMAYERQQADE